MEPALDLSLSHGDLLDVSCDKDAWCTTTSILHASAENKLVMHVSSRLDELHLLSSLHTLGYIEFDDLCNLDCLEERIFAHADLPCLSRHSYHVIGKYNNKGQYMVHRIYICTNLNAPFVVQDCDRLEGNHYTTTFPWSSRSFVLNKMVDFQEGGHHWFLPSIPALSFLGTNLLQDNVANILCRSLTMLICSLNLLCKMTYSPIGNMVTFLLTIISISFVFETRFSLVLCRFMFKYNRRRGRLSFKRGRMMRTWQPCLCPCVVHGVENMESSKVFQVKKEVQG
jgi:hypothetical protein